MGRFDNIIDKEVIIMSLFTHEDFLKKLKNNDINNIYFIEEYIKSNEKIKIRYIRCGHERKIYPSSIIRGKGHCPQCEVRKPKKRTTETLSKEIEEKTNKEYSLLGEFSGTHNKVEIKHNQCGHIFSMAPRDFLAGQRCPKHRYEKSSKSNKIDESVVRNRIKENLGEEYSMIEYNGSSRNGIFKHSKCDKEFKSVPYQLIKGVTGCPHCYKSKGEDLVEKYLLENNYTYKKQYIFKDCKNIRPLPFDFAIFKDDKLECLIEYDGEQHFKPKFGIENFEATKRNDEIKNNYCISKDINLIRIPYKRIYSNVDFKKYIYQELNKLLSC